MAEQTRPRVGNLPAEITSFVGRRAELAQAERLLAKSRLVTLIGTGGVGKTRVALRLAARARPNHPDGVWLVELSALQDVDLLAHTIAESLGMADQSLRSQVHVLADHLADRDLLLVLDTCEHLAAACAWLATTLLRAAPRLRILATSRRPLGTPGEHTLIVPPLPIPSAARSNSDPTGGDEPDDSMLLFAERAAAVDPTFSLTPQNRPAVAGLCRRLDGIPLAIELAAVRLRVMSIEQITDRLDHRFRLLVGADRPDEPRHSSLRTAIGWSHELCEPAERLLWARCSVFAGDFDLTAAEQVCADDQLPASDLVNLLTGLVEKSVVSREQCHGKVRFRLLDAVREYGEEWSAALGERPLLLRRHRDYYLRLARRSEAECMGANQFGLRDRMTLEHANIRAALDFCLAEPEGRHGLELAGSLWFYWDCCGFLQDGRYYLEQVLALDPEPSPERAKALWVCGAVVGSMGDTDRACALAADSADLADRTDRAEPGRSGRADHAGQVHQTDVLETKASALYVSAHAMALTGDPAQAVTFAKAAVEMQRRTGRPGLPLFKGLVMGAFALIVQGELIQALTLLDELRAECTEHGEMWARAYGEYLRGFVDLARGEPLSAITRGRAALRTKRRMHDTLGTAASIDLLAAAAAADGDSERASVLLGLGDQVWSALGLPQLGSPALIAVRDRCERQSREAIGDRAFEAAFRRGARIDLDAGVSYAMGEEDLASNGTDFAASAPSVTHVP